MVIWRVKRSQVVKKDKKKKKKRPLSGSVLNKKRKISFFQKKMIDEMERKRKSFTNMIV